MKSNQKILNIKQSLKKMLSFFYKNNGLRKNFRNEERKLEAKSLEIRILWTLNEISKDFGSENSEILKNEREILDRFSFLKTDFENFLNS